jgi:hypothetical protein
VVEDERVTVTYKMPQRMVGTAYEVDQVFPIETFGGAEG